MIVQTQAVVLKAFDFRETSRIATFFTRDHGKVSGVLKGIRTDPRKFGSSLDRFSVNDIVYYRYRNSDLHLVSHCDLREFFFPVRQDLGKSMAASYALELVHAIMPVEEANEGVYALLTDFLKTLEQDFDIHHLVHAFQVKMLSFSGFRPHLDACLRCRRQITDAARFSLKEGGLICPACRPSDGATHLLSKGTVASILHLEKGDWAYGLTLRLTDAVKKELKYVLNNFLVFHLGRRLRSAQYLHAPARIRTAP